MDESHRLYWLMNPVPSHTSPEPVFKLCEVAPQDYCINRLYGCLGTRIDGCQKLRAPPFGNNESDCSFSTISSTYFLVKSTIFELQCSVSGIFLQKNSWTRFFKHFFGYFSLKLLEMNSHTHYFQ